jgi:hypothetical protein
VLAFLSYSRRDRELIDRFQTVLEQSGVTVWRDTDDIRGGQEWRTSIVAAIHAADVLVLFVSPGSMASVNVRRELTVAEEEGKRIIPVLLLPTPIPDDFRYSLAGVQYVDVTNMPIEEASARVRDAVVTPPPVSAAPEFRRQPSPRPAVATETQPSAPDGASRRRWAIGVVSAIVVAACVVLAFALVGHGTDDRSTTPTTAGPLESTGTAAAANVGAETRVVDQRFGYGAFAIHQEIVIDNPQQFQVVTAHQVGGLFHHLVRIERIPLAAVHAIVGAVAAVVGAGEAGDIHGPAAAATSLIRIEIGQVIRLWRQVHDRP